MGYLLTHHVWESFWISLNGIVPCVSCVFGAPVGTGTVYFLNLIEALYDYPLVYLMLVLVICSSLLRSILLLKKIKSSPLITGKNKIIQVQFDD